MLHQWNASSHTEMSLVAVVCSLQPKSVIRCILIISSCLNMICRKCEVFEHIFHKPLGADFIICAYHNTKSPFLCPAPLPFHRSAHSAPRAFPRASSINIRALLSARTQLLTVASRASMHSFTSASEQTVEAAANGNILQFTGQWMFSPWLLLLICGTL